jgi:hypothetical protein
MKLEYVNSVVETLVDEFNYNSVIKDLISDFYIVSIFTDVDVVDIVTSETFLDDAEEFLEDTNIVDIVKANMKDGLLEELNKAISLSISYRTGIHINPLSEAIVSLISVIEKKIGEIDLGDAMNMVQKFAGMTGELTPESLVSAYIDRITTNDKEVEK